MGQNRETGKRTIHGQLIFYKGSNVSTRNRIIFLTGVEITGKTWKKKKTMNLDFYLTPYRKINLKVTCEIKISGESFHNLEETNFK